MKSLFIHLNRLLHFAFGTGSWSLLHHEQAILDACLAALPEENQAQARHQLARPFFLERMTGGRVNVIRPYEERQSERIEGSEFDDRLFKVKVDVGGERLTAHVTFLNGRVFSIETKKPTKFFKGKIVNTFEVSEGRPQDTYTRVIDRSEHGPEV